MGLVDGGGYAGLLTGKMGVSSDISSAAYAWLNSHSNIRTNSRPLERLFVRRHRTPLHFPLHLTRTNH